MSGLGTFGKYELTTRLARGGMAETYRAQLKGAAGVTKTVVIKKVLPHLAEDELFIEAFINEAKISASLSHGNIAQVFDFGRVEGDYFIAMELVDGRSLNHVLARAQEKGFAKLPPPIACYLAIEVLKGLHYAHTRVGDDGKPLSLVHRDVSPENVLISFEGDVKVVDFGVAKAVMQGRKETEPGLVKGKFLFFSPEQALAEPVDARSDLYAVGILLYRMLCGGLPFEGQMHTVMRAIVTGKFLPAAVVHPGLPSALVAVLDRAMKTKREGRFATALQFQEALASYLYRQEPTFSSETVKEWMTWLFRPELASQGKPISLSGRFEGQLTKWGSAAAAGPVPEVVTDPRAAAVTQDAAPAAQATKAEAPAKEPADSSALAPWLAIGALVVVAGIGVAVVMGSEGDGPPAARPFVPPTMREKVDAAKAEPVPVPVPVPAVPAEPERTLAPNDPNGKLFTDQHARLIPCLASSPWATTPVTVWVKVELGVVTDVTIDQATKHKNGVLKCLLTEARTWEFAVERGPPRSFGAVIDPTAKRRVKLVIPPPWVEVPSAPGDTGKADDLLVEAQKRMRDKQYAAAKTLLEKCIRAEMANADCHKLLGTTWAKLGDPLKGAAEYKEFLKYARPGHPDIDKVKAIVQQYESFK